jgi:putative flippase GtrA
VSVSATNARGEAARFVRFCIVGASNTVLTLVAFELLAAAGLAAAVASAVAFAVGATNGYFLNRSWTFRSRRRGAGTVARYVAVQAVGAACSAGGVALGSGDLSLPRILAEACVLPFATVLTYTLSRRLVFAARPLA